MWWNWAQCLTKCDVLIWSASFSQLCLSTCWLNAWHRTRTILMYRKMFVVHSHNLCSSLYVLCMCWFGMFYMQSRERQLTLWYIYIYIQKCTYVLYFIFTYTSLYIYIATEKCALHFAILYITHYTHFIFGFISISV